ncbi:hypothetical protein [Streptomyces sp. BK340]|uniref:hypothetical protein n=1 Tax=Streptomyces sp. BK340 TaxID=2572903 RepID=UPI0011A68556|nr:hypothetical protein [Streptomyces sp. BK340]TVZ86767.1 hypothetical protein FB157_117186 [Streptomyces sp. BK340]
MALLDEMTALAQAGGAAVLAAAATDGWHRFSDRAARLLGRGDPALEGAAAERLARTAAALRAASDEDERERVGAEHARLWRDEFAGLLTAPGSADIDQVMTELRTLAEEFGSQPSSAGQSIVNTTFNGPANVQYGHHSRQNIRFGAAE